MNFVSLNLTQSRSGGKRNHNQKNACVFTADIQMIFWSILFNSSSREFYGLMLRKKHLKPTNCLQLPTELKVRLIQPRGPVLVENFYTDVLCGEA
ncbi:hypothetical protein TNCV_422701 [Trichonephila clavipes]|nr:hypothetical protein TNCV_422701 [Trichonephila clavipes]